MNSLRLLFSAALLMAAPQKEYRPREEKIPGDPVPQPIAYSHKTHVALGLPCAGCHAMPGEGYLAAYPDESLCMGCHASVKTDSPEIRKLAGFASKKQPVPWKRIYQVPDIVWFNHVSHVKDASIGCDKCHGDVARRDVLFKERSTSMTACMDCHAASKAPNGCDFCHATQ